MQSIVLATHGGVSADGAALAASLLAARLHVPLIPLVVCAPIHVVDYGFGASYVPSPEDDCRGGRCHRGECADQLRQCDIRSLSPTVRTGIVPMEIAAAARALRAGLVVTGLGPHSIVDRALGGETALHLAQDATVPILAVPASVTTIPRRVIAAIDFSPTSMHAARTAAAWLRTGDELHLVSVVPKPRHTEGVLLASQGVVDRLAKARDELGVATGVRVEARSAFRRYGPNATRSCATDRCGCHRAGESRIWCGQAPRAWQRRVEDHSFGDLRGACCADRVSRGLTSFRLGTDPRPRSRAAGIRPFAHVAGVTAGGRVARAITCWSCAREPTTISVSPDASRTSGDGLVTSRWPVLPRIATTFGTARRSGAAPRPGVAPRPDYCRRS